MWRTLFYLLLLSAVGGACSTEEAGTETSEIPESEMAPGEEASLVSGRASAWGQTSSPVPIPSLEELLPEPAVPLSGQYNPFQEYEQECVGEEEPSVECTFLEGLIVAEVVEALETIEYSKDQRGAPLALAALTLQDAPEVQIAGCRVLAQFPDLPQIPAVARGLLLSPYREVQRMSAELLLSSPDQDLSQLAQQWRNGHRGMPKADPWETMTLPPQLEQLGFSEYPGSVPFPPSASKMSFAWMTSDTVEQVTEFYARKLGVEALDSMAWAERAQEATTRSQQAAMDFMNSPEFQEIQALSAQFAEKQDPEILKKLEALQEKIEKAGQDLDKSTSDPVSQQAYELVSSSPESARYLVLEEKEGLSSRLLAVFSERVFGKTVYLLIWNPEQYGTAWGEG